MNIGIYGGTFNPPHLGHMRVMQAVITKLGLEKLILMPTGQPPHKDLPENAVSADMRFTMTQWVADTVSEGRKRGNMPPCDVETNDLEIHRQGKSYTIDTLETLKLLYPEDKFYLIMGDDMFMSFFSWMDPDKIMKRATICAFLRNDKAPSPELIEQAEKVKAKFGGEVELISIKGNVAVSSSHIRENLGKNIFNPTLVPDLQPCTLGHILQHKLYGVDVDFKNMDESLLRPLVWSFVKAKRVAHIVGVELECCRLARRWAVEERLARRAGILHDITKYWSQEEHIAFCEQYHVPLDHLEWTTDKLLHAKSGAGFARHILGEAPELCDAIDCHTTAKANMSTLDKILYLADYIEPQRDFPEVEKLRMLAYEDLDKAMGYGLSITLEEMSEKNKITHQNTLQAYEQYGKA